jgi:ankyrin repeat protein
VNRTRYLAGAWVAVAAFTLTAGAASGAGVKIVDAVKSGNTQAVSALLKQKTDVNAAEPDGTTALHYAAHANNVELARMLLRAGANANAVNRYGVAPLRLAVEAGNAALADALLKGGANPNVTIPGGESILMTAARTGDPATVKMLIAAGAKVNAAEETQGQTPLIYAAKENHAAAVKVLVEGGADVNLRSKPLEWPEFKFNTGGMIYTLQPVGGWSPLMYAAREGAIDAVRALADAGADLNLADPDGTTPLILAIVNAKFDTAVALLDKGANPNVQDEMGMTALYAAVDMHTLSPMMGRPAPPLRDSIDAVEMARVLLKKGANPNLQLKKPIIGRHTAFQGDARLGEGTTPLMRAANSGDAVMVKVLLEGGADPRLTQKDGTTAGMIAANARGQRVYAAAASVSTPATEADALEALKLLLDTPLDVNGSNANGVTALHNAAGRGADELVKLLLEKGAKLDAKDKLGRLPIDMARGVGGGGGRGRGNAPGQVHETTVALLRDAMTAKGIPIPAPPARPAGAPAAQAAGQQQ